MAIFSEKKYIWFYYHGINGKNIMNKAGKRSVKLSKGSTFGLRRATSDMSKYRMIVPELGATFVFTLDNREAQLLMNKSKSA